MKPSAWDLFTRNPAAAPGLMAELSRLQKALPDYDVGITSHAPGLRFEAIRRPGIAATGPWCLISTDPADLWRELAAFTRVHAP